MKFNYTQMKICTIPFLISFIISFQYSIASFNNLGSLRRTTLRAIVFKEKKLPKMILPAKRMYDAFYNKGFVAVSNAFNYYNNLSDDEKTIIDALLALCY